ncbi:hypothetical protein [Streptomyces iconiensis]|uniref:Histidine triad (HIT) family protein n=1 Tax=Streptomyces iconiensis TaxID=1384038 RepID=A0ABT7A069_9ACTN|nr:hypothetical protein [Streptomyces iconiensis]MDJ1134439.1 hypothetical protein [Streptomyces iconiensis]
MPTSRPIRCADASPESVAAFFDNNLDDVSAPVAPLLREAEAVGDAPEACPLRAHLLQIAGSVLTQVHQHDAAPTALSGPGRREGSAARGVRHHHVHMVPGAAG